MQSSHPPDMGRVPVSTAARHLDPLPRKRFPDVVYRRVERWCLRFLVRYRGWYWLEAGTLRRQWQPQEEL